VYFWRFSKRAKLIIRLTTTKNDTNNVKSHACSFFQPFNVNNHREIFMMAPWPTGLRPSRPCSAAVRDDSGRVASPGAAATTAVNAATSSAAVRAFLCAFLLAFFLFQRALHDALQITATTFYYYYFLTIVLSQSQYNCGPSLHSLTHVGVRAYLKASPHRCLDTV